MTITATRDAALINRIANSDGVREFVAADDRLMDWTPLIARPFEETGAVVLTNGADAVAAFTYTAPSIFQAHLLFAKTCRGRKAIDTARAMLKWMFDNGATIVWGAAPRANRKVGIFGRLIGGRVMPSSDATDIVFECRLDGLAR
ncbi:hypothetical protein [Sphingomonas sp. PWP1-2]|uniref:hypothetical protein n=1 Tax=Sphingomonas sp. PWP1-2 TaxID=2804558 RepID=UPI003CF83B5D